ncbi:MAG: LacI family DNA-binding transcriptional regulator [Gracilimonas sp.]|uniref:LacI family DNA-binding transcriptional regulator n=1 Tax=Gracilimonas sp. TaxID=1974203 RepID=UPI0019C273AC|nr:LacI family DNA-binding transcriptional regulator [Gracilimonas sp.]MBD3617350.1 LacI family DNA-binding transcriptional regulator [Gracilimonas sp.]
MSSNVTLKQIAEALGVSAMTVSRVINNKANVDEKTRKRVLEKAKSMGYTPNHVAKSLVSKKTHTIGVVIPEIHHVFFSEVVSGIEAVVYENDYQLFLTNSAENAEREKNVIEALRSKRVDGILISCAENSEDLGYYKRLIKSGLNLVFFDRCVENIGASCVSVNDETSSYQITEHLINHGYTSIAHLSGPKNLSVGRERLRGYKRALEENHLPVKDEWIVESGFREEGGYKAMNSIFALPKSEWPRAVVALNDPAAFGAMKAIEEQGLSIPDDIAIVGFSDDVRAELMSCPLTTVQQPAFMLGKKAAEKLIKSIESDDEPIENIELHTNLKIRSSCGSHENT